MAILLAILIALLGGATLAAYGHLRIERAAAAAAGEDLAACRRLAHRIEELSGGPRLATEHERLSSETTHLIEKSARSAGLTGGQLVSIRPQPAQRLAETVYKEKPTRVILRRVALESVVRLMHNLVTAEQCLNVKSIQLTAAGTQTSPGRWDADVVVTYLIYDPPQRGN